MIKKSFTVNPNRTKEEINDYKKLLIKGIYQGCEFFYPFDKSQKYQEEYINNLKEYLVYDVEFVCHLPYGGKNNLATYNNLNVVMKRLKDGIVFASNLPVKKLTLHPGELDGTLSKSDAIKLACQNIKELCIFASKYEMTVMLENLVGSNELMKTEEEYLEMKKLINEPNLKFIFDVAHYHSSNQPVDYKKDIKGFIRTLKDDLWHLHISDNDGTHDAHAKLGDGNIDFEEYFKTLNEIGYNGLISSEVLFYTSDDLINTARKIDFYNK